MPLMPKLAYASYYDKRNRPGASLTRARRPYLFRNVLTGLGLTAMVISIYAYTIKAVAQDNFEDVKVPDHPVQAPTAGASTMAISQRPQVRRS